MIDLEWGDKFGRWERRKNWFRVAEDWQRPDEEHIQEGHQGRGDFTDAPAGKGGRIVLPAVGDYTGRIDAETAASDQGARQVIGLGDQDCVAHPENYASAVTGVVVAQP